MRATRRRQTSREKRRKDETDVEIEGPQTKDTPLNWQVPVVDDPTDVAGVQR